MSIRNRDVSVVMYRFDRLTGFWGVPYAERMIAFEGDKGALIRIRNNSQ